MKHTDTADHIVTETYFSMWPHVPMWFQTEKRKCVVYSPFLNHIDTVDHIVTDA